MTTPEQLPLKTRISTIIEQDYENEIKFIIGSRKRLYRASIITEYAGHIFLALGTIVAFAAGALKIDVLIFVTGVLGVISMSLLKMSMYMYNERNERSNTLAASLRSIELNNMPEVIVVNENQ